MEDINKAWEDIKYKTKTEYDMTDAAYLSLIHI